MIVWVSREWLKYGLQAVEVEPWGEGIVRTVAVIPGLSTRDGRDYFFRSRGEYADTEEKARKQAIRKAKILRADLLDEVAVIDGWLARNKLTKVSTPPQHSE